jgi:hypothetical protein
VHQLSHVNGKSRGQYCGDIELGGYLTNETGPVPLVLDLRFAHDRVGSSTDPNLNGHLKYPNNFDQSLNDAAANKVRKYRPDYNNRPPSVVSFMPVIDSTSGLCARSWLARHPAKTEITGSSGGSSHHTFSFFAKIMIFLDC